MRRACVTMAPGKDERKRVIKFLFFAALSLGYEGREIQRFYLVIEIFVSSEWTSNGQTGGNDYNIVTSWGFP